MNTTAFRARNTLLTVTTGAVLALLLSACTDTGSLSVFDRAQEGADKLPADATPTVVSKLVETSTRFLWENGSQRYYAGRTLEGSSDTCLIVLEGPEATTSCSTRLPIELSASGINPRLALAREQPGKQ
jgi:hypothetical protein